MESTAWSEFRRDCIKKYLAAGYALFPCNPDKTPRRRGWQHTPFNPALDPDSLGDAYGVVLTDADVVLDVDPRRYKDGENQLVSLWQQLNLPKADTFIVRTAGGGFHIYFKKQPHVRVHRVVPGFPAIEVKSKGQYVIGAGSMLSNERGYKHERGHIEHVVSV